MEVGRPIKDGTMSKVESRQRHRLEKSKKEKGIKEGRDEVTPKS